MQRGQRGRGGCPASPEREVEGRSRADAERGRERGRRDGEVAGQNSSGCLRTTIAQ